LWINLKLLPVKSDFQQTMKVVLLQQNFLKYELRHNKLAYRMQHLYPEGFVFIHVLYGLTWCEVGIKSNDQKLRSQALTEALYAYEQITAPEVFWNFDENISPSYGIFLLGWKNYLLSKILLINDSFNNRAELINQYESNCKEIFSAFEKSKSPFLLSYEGAAWPADNVVAIASLAHYHKILDSKYNSFVVAWVKEIKSKLDEKTQMIPHQVHYTTGEILSGARGSSSSLMIRLLAEIDPLFAKSQYQQFQKYFATTLFGLPFISEFPKGQSGESDIDSGPVILGVGFAATIVSVGTHAAVGNIHSAEDQYKTINAFGFPLTTSNNKRYLFGQLPIADAFIAWSRITASNIAPSNKTSFYYKFHFLSLIVIFLTWLALRYQKKPSA